MKIPWTRFSRGFWGRAGVAFLILAPFMASCSDPAAPFYAFWEGNLGPIRPNLVSGRVVAVTQQGKTDIGITMENGEAAVTYGWRVDSGGCEEVGTIQGGPASYPSLLPGQGGSASAQTSVAALFKPGKRFAARIFHSGAGGFEEVVACGELEETSG